MDKSIFLIDFVWFFWDWTLLVVALQFWACNSLKWLSREKMLWSDLVEREIPYNSHYLHFCCNSSNNGATLVWTYTLEFFSTGVHRNQFWACNSLKWLSREKVLWSDLVEREIPYNSHYLHFCRNCSNNGATLDNINNHLLGFNREESNWWRPLGDSRPSEPI